MSEYVVSFIIPVLNGERHIGRVLESLVKEMGAEDEIIVVDNGSTDRTKAIVAECAQATLVSDPNATIAGLRNLGASQAKGNLFAFIDSDCMLIPGWRSSTIDAFDRLPAQAVGSRVGIPDDASWIERAWQSMRSTEEMPVAFINSANLVVAAPAFASVNGFDQTLITNEDVDFCFRLNQSDLPVWEVPAIRVENVGVPATLGQFFRQRKWHFQNAPQILSAGKLDRANVITYGVLLCWAGAVISLVLSVLGRCSHWLPLLLVVIGPLLATAYRLLQFGRWGYGLHLLLLHTVFFAARGVGLIEFLTGSQKRSWRR